MNYKLNFKLVNMQRVNKAKINGPNSFIDMLW